MDYEEASTIVSNLQGDVDISKLSEAETKYLGGDMRFTHLVKGLDYALLEKVGMRGMGTAGVIGRVHAPCGLAGLVTWVIP